MNTKSEQSEFSKKIREGLREGNKKFYEKLSKEDGEVVIMLDGKIQRVKAKVIYEKYYSDNKKT